MKLIIKVIFNALIKLITLILTPLDLLITNVFPDIATGLSYINSFFTWVLDFIRFILSWLPFTPAFYTFFVAAIVFYYSIPIITHVIKLAVKWYYALKP